MPAFDRQRLVLVVATSSGDDQGDPHEEVATGYLLTGDLVLTAAHVARRPGCSFEVRGLPQGTREAIWSNSVPVWKGADGIDALVLRTKRSFGDLKLPSFPMLQQGRWESAGYARAGTNEETGARNSFPLSGSFDVSGGQDPDQFVLTTEQDFHAQWDHYWMGISGAPIFSKGAPEGDGLVGLITDASRASPNSLTALQVGRLLKDVAFQSIVHPSFLAVLPDGPWCAVLTAEHSDPRLIGHVQGVLTGFRKHDRLRDLYERPIEIPVIAALSSTANWVSTVRALARAEFLVADVTQFEPAMMLLLGVRSVLRRGVTVSVTGEQLRGDSAAMPFNVQETRVLSYGEPNFYARLGRAMAEGAATLEKDRNYLDLPTFHAVRAPRPESWAREDRDQVLVLCPFGSGYSDFYEGTLHDIIQAHTGNQTPLRMLDLQSPRLVGQALYEQVRWATRCLVDWTHWRPNVFFEFGVRLACSPHDPLCIIDADDPAVLPESSATELKQKAMLRELLPPVAYERGDHRDPRNALMRPLETWARPEPDGGDPHALPPMGTFTAAQAHFSWEGDAVLTPPHVEQRGTAERILGRDPERTPERLILFSDNAEYDDALNAAVRERWISAWLYLRHLNSVVVEGANDTHEEFILMSRLAMNALRSSTDERHDRLRAEIRAVLDADTVTRRAARARRRGQKGVVEDG